MEEMWLEMHSPVSADSLIRFLASYRGEPNGPSQSFRDAIFCASSRQNLPIWHRAGMNVWVVDRIGPKLPVAIYARNDIPAEKDWYDAVDGLQAKVAEQSAATLAKTIANRSRYVLLGKRAARRTQGPLRSDGADFRADVRRTPSMVTAFVSRQRKSTSSSPRSPARICSRYTPFRIKNTDT